MVQIFLQIVSFVFLSFSLLVSFAIDIYCYLLIFLLFGILFCYCLRLVSFANGIFCYCDFSYCHVVLFVIFGMRMRWSWYLSLLASFGMYIILNKYFCNWYLSQLLFFDIVYLLLARMVFFAIGIFLIFCGIIFFSFAM